MNAANDKLSLLWALAADEYVKDLIAEAEAHRADAKIDEATERRILRMIRRDYARTKRRKVWKVLRIALVACLALATLALAACMAFPTVREAIWNVVLDWNSEYVKVDFVPPEEIDNTAHSSAVTTTTSPTSEPKPEPPQSIEEVNMPGYMPVGYTTKSSMRKDTFILDYYNTDGDNVITYIQNLVTKGSLTDAEEGISTEVTINGLNAILFTYEDEPNVYSLYWQDSEYRYHIYAYLESYDELIRLASSVEVK